MAKFQGKHLKLKDDQRVYFGTSDDSSIWHDGTQLRIATVVSGVDPTQDYHLTTRWYVDNVVTTLSGYLGDHGNLIGLGDDDHSYYVPTDGSRGFTNTVSGVTPTQDYHLTTKQYVDDNTADINMDWQDSVLDQDLTAPPGGESTGDRYIVGSTATGAWAGHDGDIAEWNGSSWDFFVKNEGFAAWVEDEDLIYVYNGTSWVKMASIYSHSVLADLTADDHTQYILVDGTRGFTGTVSGISPTANSHLTTKQYVDNLIPYVPTDHDEMGGLGDDDHTQYILVDGTRGFTGTVSGVAPTNDNHLTTKQYVDTISGVLGDHGNLTGLGDDDHNYYVPTDGSRGFTSTVSGVTPITDYHLTTKEYVDDEITTLSGFLSDHGNLSGLDDDDHNYYVPTDGSRGFTNTVSGIDPVQDYHLATKSYVDSISDDKHQSGRITMATNDSSKAVAFGTAYADTNYTVSIILSNTVDATPSIYPMMVSAKATTGFTVLLSGDIDSNNYVLEWLAKHD